MRALAVHEPMSVALTRHAPRHSPGADSASPSPRAARLQRLGAVLDRLWASRWHGLGLGAATVVLWGVIAGWWMPRGPLTTAEALWSMVLSCVVGVLAGVLARSRWAMLGAPALFALVVEVTRIGTDGPLVDGPRASMYGLIAFVVGRGVHGVLALVPMMVGVAIGAGTARTIRARYAPGHAAAGGSPRGLLLARRGLTVLVTVGLVVFGAMLARPARTAPIVDEAGNRVPGSVAELLTVDSGGHELALMIRGWSVDNPVLLFLAGGPGGSELGAMRTHLPALEEHFTVVTWDQRGTGKSYPELDPTDTLTLDSAVADTLAVTDYLRGRFGQDRIYLLGQSWGSTLGVLAVQAAPEKYVAFIGTGQMVSQLATDTIFYDDTLAWANETGRAGLVDELTDIGHPPYASILDYEVALSHEHDVYPYDHSPNAEGRGGFSENFFVEEYTLLEQLHLFAGFLDTFAVLYPQLQDIDFRRDATSFEIPVFFVQGANEAGGRATVFEEWYPMIDAPLKDVTHLATAGHRPLFEQPAEFVGYMVDTVLASTQLDG